MFYAEAAMRDPFVAAIQRDDVVEVENVYCPPGCSPTESLHFSDRKVNSTNKQDDTS
jgi:hypothetical protein